MPDLSLDHILERAKRLVILEQQTPDALEVSRELRELVMAFIPHQVAMRTRMDIAEVEVEELRERTDDLVATNTSLVDTIAQLTSAPRVCLHCGHADPGGAHDVS